MNIHTKLFSAEKELKTFFGELFDKTDQRIMSAARHGVSNAINKIKEKTRSNISSSWFNSSSSRKYGIGLIEGARAFMYRGLPTGFATILGNTRTNDGTWRLRLFEGGTVDRVPNKKKLREGRNNAINKKGYGHIRPAWFFASAISSVDSDSFNEIKSAIEHAIDEINNSNK